MSTAFSALELVAAGCGGGGAADDPSPSAPELPAAPGDSFATNAEEVAALLAAGDVASARERAHALQEDVRAAIDAGKMPNALEKKLLAGVKRLLSSIPTEVEPPVEKPAEESEEKNDEGKKEDKGKGDEEEALEEEPLEEEPLEEEPLDEIPGESEENGNGDGGNASDG